MTPSRTDASLGPVVLGRDHHDVSGTDSPYRETSNIYDGSAFTADMAVQNFAGDAFRGATWIAAQRRRRRLGRVMNGGFGMLIDGSADRTPPHLHAALGRQQRHCASELGAQ